MSGEHNRTLYIIRGLPGSGKSTLAKRLVNPEFHREADMFFVNEDGEYIFNPERIRLAHQWCQYEIERLMLLYQEDVCVSNTFTQHWEMLPYLKLAQMYGYSVQVIELHTPSDQWSSVHGVPKETVEKMAKRWEPTELL